MHSPHFLITRLSAVGDCMVTLPLAVAIKDHWPASRLTWVVDCGASQLLETHPAIDRLIRVRKGFLKRPRELARLVSQLRSTPIDFSIDPQGLFKSAVLGWLAGARCRIGFNSDQSREFAWRFYHDAVEPTAAHLVERQLELLEPLGVFDSKIRFGWIESDSIANYAQQTLRDRDLEEGSFAIINPGAGWESKRLAPRTLCAGRHPAPSTHQSPFLGGMGESRGAPVGGTHLPRRAASLPHGPSHLLVGISRTGSKRKVVYRIGHGAYSYRGCRRYTLCRHVWDDSRRIFGAIRSATSYPATSV